ncbi:LacI family DNA-binding transcriptional regulator [Latilactobacillus sakei]
MPKILTIKEIAKLSGVSVSTVSRVINNSPNVSAVKRDKVQSIIDEYQFKPNMVARSMISKHTQTIALVVSDIRNPYFIALVSQIEEISRQYDYSVLLFNTMTGGKQQSIENENQELTVFKTIEEKQVDGIVILGGEIDREQIDVRYRTQLNQLAGKIPTVIIGQPIEDCQATFVARHQEQSGQIVTQHLLALGYRKIGFIGGSASVRITQERLRGYRETMQIYADVDEQQIILNDYYVQDGYQAIEQLIQQDKLPEALVAINDEVALGAVRALRDQGLNVPQDIAIASCDAFPNSDYQVPRLTTIDHHNDVLGEQALTQLMQLIDQEPPIALTAPMPELIIRESCGSQYLKERTQNG